jgi:RHS repeat-associated protein
VSINKQIKSFVLIALFSCFSQLPANAGGQCPEGYHPVGVKMNSDGSFATICEKNSSGGGGGSSSGSSWAGMIGSGSSVGYSGAFSGVGGTSGGSSADGKGEETEQCGNPIMVQSGNKMQFESDYTGKGEFPLTIERTYNKAWLGTGVFGEKWITNYGHKLTFVYGTSGPQCTLDPGELPEFSCEQPGTGAVSLTQVIAYRPGGMKIQFTYDNYLNAWVDYKAESVQRLEQVGNEWFLTTEAEILERYDVTGKILQRTSPSGVYHKFVYSGDTLTKVIHSSGRDLDFTWTSGLLTRITDAAGNKYDYTYNADGYLASAIRAGSPTRRKYYYYEDARFPGALTKIRVNNNDYAYFTYHSDGRGASTYHRNNTDNFSFAYGSNSTTVTNPFGLESTYHYKNENGRDVLDKVDRAEGTYCPSANRSVTYDSNGYIDIQTDWKGNVTDFDFNAKGQLTKVTEAFGTSDARTKTYQWLAGENRIIQQSNADNKIDYVYTSKGRVSSTTVTNLSSYGIYGETRTTNLSYTSNGKGIVTQLIVDGPRTDVTDTTTYDFDSQGNLTKVTNALGHVVTYSQYDAIGNVGRIVDANGLQTDLTYDGASRILTKSINNSEGNQTIEYRYSGNGNLWKVINPDDSSITYIYDLAQRHIKTLKSDGSAIHYGYNANGNRTSTRIAQETTTVTDPCVIIPWPRPVNPPIVSPFSVKDSASAKGNASVKVVNPCDPITTIKSVDTFSNSATYDSMGRLRETGGNNNQSTIYGYDDNSNVNSITDALNHSVNMTYNALNQLVTSTARDGGITSYQYDASGRVKKVTDARGLATHYFYNGFGNLTTLISPDTGTTKFTYNKAGLVLSKELNDGTTSYYTYDALGRIKSEDYIGLYKSYNYDGGTYGKGRLFFVSEGQGNINVFTYDKVGNVITKRSEIENINYYTHYTYDTMNRRTQVTYPSGHKVNYAYDEGGNVSSVTYQNGSTIQNIATNIKYHAFGPMTSLTHGNGAIRQITYDMDYRPTKIYTSGIQNLNYLFDSKNNISKITNSQQNSLTQTYGYSNTDRLTSVVSSSGNHTYSYDNVGNRKSHTASGVTKTLSYANKSNQLVKVVAGFSTNTVSHNANGHITIKDGVTFNYNSRNRLSSLTKNGQTTSFLYNAMGQRTKKSGPNGTTHFLYNEQGLLIAEHNSSGTVQKEYVYLNGKVIGLIKNNTRYYVHNDHMGRTERITNQNKGTVWLASNFAFDRAVTTNSIGDYNIGFPGQYFDVESGTYYNYFRDYDSSTGRYLQSDPIGLEGGINTYGYVNGNPLRFIDPLGLASFSFDAYAGIGGGITIGYNPMTGSFFGGGRLGYGFGAGGNLNVTDMGPESIPRRETPNSEACGDLAAGKNGFLVGTNISLGAGIGPYGLGFSAQGGRFFDGSGHSYSELGFGPGFNAQGGGFGVSFGGAGTVEVIGWGG